MFFSRIWLLVYDMGLSMMRSRLTGSGLSSLSPVSRVVTWMRSSITLPMRSVEAFLGFDDAHVRFGKLVLQAGYFFQGQAQVIFDLRRRGMAACLFCAFGIQAGAQLFVLLLELLKRLLSLLLHIAERCQVLRLAQ